jgi:hypothetical protein
MKKILDADGVYMDEVGSKRAFQIAQLLPRVHNMVHTIAVKVVIERKTMHENSVVRVFIGQIRMIFRRDYDVFVTALSQGRKELCSENLHASDVRPKVNGAE